MRTLSVRVRLLAIAAVVTVAVWTVYPPAEKISLGLDLEGGLQLVLRVRTDDALRAHTRLGAEQLQEALVRAGASHGSVEVVDASAFRVADVAEVQTLRDVSGELQQSFDRTTERATHTFRLKPQVVREIRRETVQRAIETIERRVNELGLTEPTVAPYGSDDRILLQLPGVEDVEGAKRVIRATAQLRLTLVEGGPFQSRELALAAHGHSVPQAIEILPGPADAEGEPQYYAVTKEPAITGADLRSVQQALDDFNRPAVEFTLRQDAARRFGEFTARNIDRLMATVIDDRVISVATIISRIDDRGQIVGLTREEMSEQVITLKSGAMPAGLDYLDQRTVSATLGQASIRAGLLASIGGLVLVTVFMLAYYGTMGVNAFVSIALNLLILLALMTYFGARLTLPGIAGLVLTIGMGVDSNVLIFERIREERASAASARADALRQGLRAPRATSKGVRAAFDRVWITIVDTHVASLLAAAVLYQFGTGAVRGFALTLAIGLLSNVFTAVFVSKTLFDVSLGRQRRQSA